MLFAFFAAVLVGGCVAVALFIGGIVGLLRSRPSLGIGVTCAVVSAGLTAFSVWQWTAPRVSSLEWQWIAYPLFGGVGYGVLAVLHFVALRSASSRGR